MRIKTITTFTEIKAEGKRFKSSYKEYDDKGYLLKEYRYSQEGEILSENLNEYDMNHLLIGSSFFDTEQESSETHKFEYSGDGKIVKEIADFGQGYLSIFIYEYSNSGKTAKIMEQDEDGTVEETKIQEFDDSGNIIKETIINEDGKEITITYNSYDTNGRPTRKEEHDLKYRTVQVMEYTYNENEQITLVKTTNQKNHVLNWVKLEYDDQKRPIKQTTMSGSVITVDHPDEFTKIEKHINSHGYVYSESTIIINEWGNLLKEDSPETETVYEYEYFDS